MKWFNQTMMARIQSLKGTRDFYPEDMTVRTWLYDTIRRVSESFGYQEYEGPLLESIDLYAAKSGEELVKKQSFVFEDRGGDLITLRPELTPTLARMVAQRQRQLVYPLRWWSFGPFWRYESPQKGRSREFFQWNIDMIGVDTPEADAELIAVAVEFFIQIGLSPTQAVILVNNRSLMDDEFELMGISPELRPEVLRLIDRRDKLAPKEWESYAQDVGIDVIQIEALKSMLSNQELWQKSETMIRLFDALQVLGVSDYVRYAPHIVRGLDYYTGTVFEAWDVEGEFRALFGGGRYDNLVEAVGGDPLPAVGFAMGDVVITLLLKKYGLVPEALDASPAPVLVTVFDQGTLLKSIALAAELRAQGLNVACYPEPVKLGKQFKFADRIGARIAIVLGPDEIISGTVAVKNLLDGSQESVPRNDAVNFINRLIEPRSGR
jgi:histidyl-tRNA synthetase